MHYTYSVQKYINQTKSLCRKFNTDMQVKNIVIKIGTKRLASRSVGSTRWRCNPEHIIFLFFLTSVVLGLILQLIFLWLSDGRNYQTELNASLYMLDQGFPSLTLLTVLTFKAK